jgi:hypothetical protein
MIDLYTAMVFLHIVLFVYWLGPDWAVYLLSPSIWRADRAIEERLESMRLLIRMTQISRNALILLLPVGLTLAALGGVSMLTESWLAAAWAFCLAWLVMSLFMFHQRSHPLTPTLNRIDALIRWALMILLVGVGLHSLFFASVLLTPWVAAKVILYGLLLGNSLQQRAIALRWMRALQDIKADPAGAAVNEGVFAATGRRSQFNAYFTWGASLAIGFFGVTKLTF